MALNEIVNSKFEASAKELEAKDLKTIHLLNEVLQLVNHPVSTEELLKRIEALDASETVKSFCINTIISIYSK